MGKKRGGSTLYGGVVGGQMGKYPGAQGRFWTRHKTAAKAWRRSLVGVLVYDALKFGMVDLGRRTVLSHYVQIRCWRTMQCLGRESIAMEQDSSGVARAVELATIG